MTKTANHQDLTGFKFVTNNGIFWPEKVYKRIEKVTIPPGDRITLDGYGVGVMRDETHGFPVGAVRLEGFRTLQVAKKTHLGSTDDEIREGQVDAAFQAVRKKLSPMVMDTTDDGVSKIVGPRSLKRANSDDSSDVDFMAAIIAPADLLAASKAGGIKTSSSGPRNKGAATEKQASGSGGPPPAKKAKRGGGSRSKQLVELQIAMECVHTTEQLLTRVGTAAEFRSFLTESKLTQLASNIEKRLADDKVAILTSEANDDQEDPSDFGADQTVEKLAARGRTAIQTLRSQQAKLLALKEFVLATTVNKKRAAVSPNHLIAIYKALVQSNIEGLCTYPLETVMVQVLRSFVSDGDYEGLISACTSRPTTDDSLVADRMSTNNDLNFLCCLGLVKANASAVLETVLTKLIVDLSMDRTAAIECLGVVAATQSIEEYDPTAFKPEFATRLKHLAVLFGVLSQDTDKLYTEIAADVAESPVKKEEAGSDFGDAIVDVAMRRAGESILSRYNTFPALDEVRKAREFFDNKDASHKLNKSWKLYYTFCKAELAAVTYEKDFALDDSSTKDFAKITAGLEEAVEAGDRVHMSHLTALTQQNAVLLQTCSNRFRHVNRDALAKVESQLDECIKTVLATNMTLYWDNFKQLLELHAGDTRPAAPQGIKSLTIATCH